LLGPGLLTPQRICVDVAREHCYTYLSGDYYFCCNESGIHVARNDTPA
jgi:hypothetical protein